MSSQSRQPPGRGIFGWLGRQVGYVRAAIRTDPAADASKIPPDKTATDAKPIFERRIVEESVHPVDPRIKLRRTTIDEAIIDSIAEPDRPGVQSPEHNTNPPTP